MCAHECKGFAGAAIIAWNTEAYTNGTLVAHVRGARARPLGLGVTYSVRNATISSIYQQGNAGIHDLAINE